jgi:hypothetical protein
MKLVTFILNIFLNDVFFYLIRAALILADAGLALWILNSHADIGFHWLVVISLILFAAGWGLYRFLTKKEAGANGSAGSHMGRICDFFRNLRKAKKDEAKQEPLSDNENAGSDTEDGRTDWSDPDSVTSEDVSSSSYADDIASDSASSYADDTASYDNPDYRERSDTGSLPPVIPDKVPVGMGSKLVQIIFWFALFCCFSYEVFKDAPTSIMGMITNLFKSEIVVKTESELMGIQTIEKLYTGFISIDKEDMHYDEGMLSGRYLDGICIKKYRIHYGYRDLGKYLDDEKVMEAVCSGNTAALPKPELLAVNSQTQEQAGKYDVSGDCFKWDADPERRNGMLIGEMNRYRIFNVKDSQKQLLTFLQPACDAIFAKKAEAEPAAAAAGSEEVSPDGQKK